MADGEIKIDTRLDTSGLDKGLKDVKSKMDATGKQIDGGTKQTKSFASGLASVSKTAVATAAGVAAVGVAVKKTVDALNDCAAAYRVQQKAEIALQQAAKNNPYLSDDGVRNLKNYASELQKVSNIGDELSIQVMSQLAATGRTEQEIRDIMSAAADMAAVTGQDLASAAQQLNATLNGNAGTLGRQITSINNLTKAELESGKAIELVAQQYKGSAAAMADTGTQLSNAWGDFKENIGRGWENVTKPVKQFFLETLSSINEAVSKTQALKDQTYGQSQGAYNSEELQKLIDEKQKKLDEALEKQNKALENSQQKLKEWADFWGTTVDDPNLPALPPEIAGSFNDLGNDATTLQIELELLKKELEEVSAAERDAANAANEQAAAEQAAAAAAAARQRNEDAATLIKNNTDALNAQIKAMQIKADLMGEEVSAADMYNAYMQSYIDLVTKDTSLVTENNTAAKQRLKTLQEWAEKAKNAADEQERLKAVEEQWKASQALAEEVLKERADLLGRVYGDEALNTLEKFKAKEQELAKLKEELNRSEILSEKQKADAILEVDEQLAQNRKDLWRDMSAEISGYIEQTASVVKDASALMLKNVQSESDLEQAKLEEKYRNGELAESEYYEKSKEIKRKAAQEEYKIKMFEWTASLLAATANIAEGVTKAIAQGGAAGVLTGLLVGAAGAVQLGSIVASKPIPPSFYTGGIIGGANGATMGGDNTYIHARRGEMVMNAAQQRNLWDMINGKMGQAGLDVTVNNTQSGRVDTDIKQTNNGLVVEILDKHINKGFTDGTYDAGLAAMNTRQEGVRIL